MHYIDELAHKRDLNHLPADSIIVMDNVPFHRNVEVREIMTLRGFEYKFLPAYSLFFNPIECMFSQWKNYVKRSKSENINELHDAINNVRNVITAENLNGFVNHVHHNCIACLAGTRVFDH